MEKYFKTLWLGRVLSAARFRWLWSGLDFVLIAEWPPLDVQWTAAANQPAVGARVAPDVRLLSSLVCKVTRACLRGRTFHVKGKGTGCGELLSITHVNQTLTCIRITWPLSKDTDGWAHPPVSDSVVLGWTWDLGSQPVCGALPDAARRHSLQTTEGRRSYQRWGLLQGKKEDIL